LFAVPSRRFVAGFAGPRSLGVFFVNFVSLTFVIFVGLRRNLSGEGFSLRSLRSPRFHVIAIAAWQ
jgi:hypothetical protein